MSGSKNEKERLGLQEDIQTSKQCLEVCKVVSEISRQKIYRIGEVVADGDSDQVLVTNHCIHYEASRSHVMWWTLDW